MLAARNSIPLSAYDRSRLVTEHATRAQAAEKVLHAGNPEPTNISDQITVLDDKDKMLL